VAGGPFGGDVNFYKPQMSTSYYFPTFWKFVFSLSARGGFVRHFSPSKEVPIAERFVMGGVDTVRGYDFGEIGPANYGRLMTVFNAEYKFPIVQERNRTILQGAFFADAGGSWDHANNVDMRIGSQPEQMRAGVGFGIRFKTPVFPIRLDWGYGLNHRPGEQISQFYFTIGNIF
jgi:outer membrane protein insertion porin family